MDESNLKIELECAKEIWKLPETESRKARPHLIFQANFDFVKIPGRYHVALWTDNRQLTVTLKPIKDGFHFYNGFDTPDRVSEPRLFSIHNIASFLGIIEELEMRPTTAIFPILVAAFEGENKELLVQATHPSDIQYLSNGGRSLGDEDFVDGSWSNKIPFAEFEKSLQHFAHVGVGLEEEYRNKHIWHLDYTGEYLMKKLLKTFLDLAKEETKPPEQEISEGEDDLLESLWKLYDSLKFKEAIAGCTYLLIDHPGEDDFRLLRTFAYYADGQYKKAYQDVLPLVATDPASPIYVELACMIALACKDAKACAQYLDEAINSILLSDRPEEKKRIVLLEFVEVVDRLLKTGKLKKTQLTPLVRQGLFEKPAPDEPIFKRSEYHFSKIANWDHEINRCAKAFKKSHGFWPTIMLASSTTYKKIDIVANQSAEHIRGGKSGAKQPEKYVSLSGFEGEDYSLDMCVDENLKKLSFALIYDTDPEGREEVPTKDGIERKKSEAA